MHAPAMYPITNAVSSQQREQQPPSHLHRYWLLLLHRNSLLSSSNIRGVDLLCLPQISFAGSRAVHIARVGRLSANPLCFFRLRDKHNSNGDVSQTPCAVPHFVAEPSCVVFTSVVRHFYLRTGFTARTLPNDSCKAAFIIANCAFSFSTLDGLANDSRAASSAI